MIDISGISTRYAVRTMTDSDAEDILALCLQNTQYYQYCGKQPSRELILNDLHITPPGKDASSKYYIGFYDGTVLVAVMDLIREYPDNGHCFIGFFMMNRQLQGKGTGSGIIQETCRYLRKAGFNAVQLGIDRDNPQSTHFWKKNGFVVLKEVDRNGWPILYAEKKI